MTCNKIVYLYIILSIMKTYLGKNNILEEYSILQDDTIPNGYVDGKLCNRECNGKNFNCFYNFELEIFFAMGKACFDCPNTISDCWRPECIVAGGIQRMVTVINRQLPGPSIEVCQGDKVMVLLQNRHLGGEATALHWHGQHVRRNKYMDGVPMITQCAILKDNNFTYTFHADNAGTYYWHSHSDLQFGEGVYGALIVRIPASKNLQVQLYDYDLSSHVIQVADWNTRSRLEILESYGMTTSRTAPTGILVNGLGYQSTTNITNTPSANFTVKSGYRYRFRLINAGFGDCPLEVSIDSHKMLIIASDGSDLQPFEVDSFISTTGERFDFVLTANQNVFTYYIRVKGHVTCRITQAYTVATLIYEGSTTFLSAESLPGFDNAAPTGGVILNPISNNDATGYSKVIGIDETRALRPLQDGLNSNNIERFYITISMSPVNNPVYNKVPYYSMDQVTVPRHKVFTPQFNHISYKHTASPLLPARFKLNPKEFCNEETMRDQNCEKNFCHCPHVIQVSKNAMVEFVFHEVSYQEVVNPRHNVHLHGYKFSILGLGEYRKNLTKEEFIQMDKDGKLKRNFVNPSRKDTVFVPKNGYAIVRFKADNVGYWFLHCHVGYHGAEGMNMVLKVGENEVMPPVPKKFPECGNWP